MIEINAGVVKFQGTNCENETLLALNKMGFNAQIIDENETNLSKYKLIVLAGGFSYGDYVSCGRIAKFSPVMQEIKNVIKNKSAFILGICNGFQILTEAHILEGALLPNIKGRFICDDVRLNFLNKSFKLPIAHHQGRYYIDDKKKLEKYELITYENNLNGSYYDIAGLYDKKNHIMGLMPHPERNLITPYKNKDGEIIFNFIRESIEEDFYGIIRKTKY